MLDLIINSHNPNFSYDDYINHFYNGVNNNNKDLNPEYVLYDAIKIMNKKYKLNETILAINNFINDGNKNNITRLDNLRSKLYNSNFRFDIINLMADKNTSFVSLCYSALDKYEKSY